MSLCTGAPVVSKASTWRPASRLPQTMERRKEEPGCTSNVPWVIWLMRRETPSLQFAEREFQDEHVERAWSRLRVGPVAPIETR